jgi:cellulose synthase/poly-beta-1,6-N-acetylglucosamine synthase-like glycosyltransferase
MNDPVKIIGYIIYGIYILTSFWLFLNALVQLHLIWHYKRKKISSKNTFTVPSQLPFVSIQVPVYNEKYVIERLLDSISAFDYPKSCFEVQVLDDSTDETSSIIDRKVAALKNADISIQVVRRKERKGYKAGALQDGLAQCKGDLIAIFDADFTPAPGFLKSMVPYFSDPRTGLVQARWGHLNRGQNCLTRIQTFLLDTHFSIEQTGRSKAGYFINFCGTAGIWRRQCIVDAGGWDGNVLSEDLDLSYRAQLKGWKLVYDQQVEVPAELPSVMEAFKIQQFRWTKGMAQISKKMMMRVVRSTLPFGKKLHAIFHLLGSFVFVCLLVNALLTIPLLVLRNMYPEFIELTQYTLFTTVNLIALTLFYYNGTKSSTMPEGVKFFSNFPVFLVIYMGMSVQNAFAVLQGLFGSKSEFVRTPKSDINTSNVYLSGRITWINVIEALMLCYFISGIVLSFYLNDYFMMLFFIMIGCGLSYIIYQSLLQVTPRRVERKMAIG